jgi:hypothetical protein
MTFRTVAIGMLPGAAMAVSLRWVKAGRARRSRAAR